MIETQQTGPTASLEFDEQGDVVLTVSARLRPGARNWTAAEAAFWFARSWQRAEDALATVTVQRAIAAGSGAHLLRRGDSNWLMVTNAGVSIDPEQSAIASSPSDLLVEQELFDGDSMAVSLPNEMAPEPLPSMPIPVTAASVMTVPAARIPERIAETPDQRKVIRHLNRAGRAMSVADLKRDTALSEYRIKKALEDLTNRGCVQSERVEVGGRWKEAMVYSGSGQR